MKLPEIAEIPREDLLEIIEEKRDNAAIHNHLYRAKMKSRHESLVIKRKFKVGELVPKTSPHVRDMARASKYKSSPRLEAPYIVGETH